jgi:hypothetical protein
MSHPDSDSQCALRADGSLKDASEILMILSPFKLHLPVQGRTLLNHPEMPTLFYFRLDANLHNLWRVLGVLFAPPSHLLVFAILIMLVVRHLRAPGSVHYQVLQTHRYLKKLPLVPDSCLLWTLMMSLSIFLPPLTQMNQTSTSPIQLMMTKMPLKRYAYFTFSAVLSILTFVFRYPRVNVQQTFTPYSPAPLKGGSATSASKSSV